jgi:hypothetical protein
VRVSTGKRRAKGVLQSGGLGFLDFFYRERIGGAVVPPRLIGRALRLLEDGGVLP